MNGDNTTVIPVASVYSLIVRRNLETSPLYNQKKYILFIINKPVFYLYPKEAKYEPFVTMDGMREILKLHAINYIVILELFISNMDIHVIINNFG
jgi:hypothetical protein